MTKTTLRKKFKALKFRNIEDKSYKILTQLFEDPILSKARNIGIFYPRKHEPDLLPLWFKYPKKFAFPKVLKTSMNFYHVSSLYALREGYGGIFEPLPATNYLVKKWSDKDVIFVPGLFFDKNGHRLGSGKGFFDRFLSKIPKSVIKVGICFSSQVVEEIPTEEHDIRMDFLLTEKGKILPSEIS